MSKMDTWMVPVLDVLLRVPPIFMLDVLCNEELKEHIFKNENIKVNPDDAVILYTLLIIIC